MSTSIDDPYRVSNLLKRIPRGPSGKIVNSRMAQVYKCLKMYSYTGSELDFFEKEIKICRNRYDKWRTNYALYKANPAWETELPPEDPHEFIASMEDF